MTRFERLFERLADHGRGGLSIYLPCGVPDKATSLAAMRAALDAGADWLEIGIPFSDPAADGPVIAAATHAAVAAGITVDDCLDILRQVRESHPDAPLIAMTYANLAVQAGWKGFAARLAEAEADGCILADVPLEESGPIRDALEAEGLAWIPLVAPTTPPERMAAIAASGGGFLYVVGNVGPTGQDDPGALVEKTVPRARAQTHLPLAVGFGISRPADVRRVLAAGADAAIVGSRAVQALGEGIDALRGLVTSLREAT